MEVANTFTSQYKGFSLGARKFRGIFVKKASHLSRCVKGTLRNIKNVVGNFLTCTDGHKGGLKCDVCFLA